MAAVLLLLHNLQAMQAQRRTVQTEQPAWRRVAADQKSGLKLEAITDMLRLAMASAEPGSASSGRASRAQGYRVHIHTTAAAASGPGPKRPPGGQTSMLDGQPTLSYWCFTPGAAMHELANLKVWAACCAL